MNASPVSTAWSWRHGIAKSGLPPTTRHLLLTMSLFMNECGEGCYPSIEDLMDATGLSKNAVLKHICVAVDNGWLRRGNHGLRGQKWRRAEYEAAWPGRSDAGTGDAANADADTGTDIEPADSADTAEGGARGAPPIEQKVVHEVDKGGAPRGPKVVHDVHQDKDQSIHQSNTSPVERERASARDDPRFRKFLKAWPTSVADDKARTAAAWEALGAAERQAAVEGVPAFAAAMKRLNRRYWPAGFTYLRDRKWLDLPDQAVEEVANAPHPVEPWSREWWVLVWARLAGGGRVTFWLERAVAGEAMVVKAAERPATETVSRFRQIFSDDPAWAAWDAWLAARGTRFPRWRTRQRIWVPSLVPGELAPPEQEQAEQEQAAQ